MCEWAENSVLVIGTSSYYKSEMKNKAVSLGFKNIIDLGE